MTGDRTRNPQPFRVLALDGGGIKGTFSAAVLATFEEMNPRLRLADHFDLIVGTSTGGIIAIGLGLGLTAGDILKFYEDQGPAIFPATGPFGGVGDWLRRARQVLLGPKYDLGLLRDALEAVFRNRLLGESTRRLVISSYDATRGDIKLFKTAHHHKLKLDYRCRAVDVALATSAAPTYFEQATTSRGHVHIDGGIWANCPVVVGILEAQLVLEQPLDRVEVPSIGTTDEPFSVSEAEGRMSAVRRAKRIPELILRAQKAGALAQARLLVRERLTRIDETVQPGRFELDDPSSIRDLRSLGETAARHSEARVAERFFAPGVAPRFEPVYSIGPTAEAFRAHA
jgi:patatin-like phospholipase/acyl hydrolase